MTDVVRPPATTLNGAPESGRSADMTPTAGDGAWRHRMMTIGHDPLKPVPS
jgi:hypothetical protein